MKARLTDAFVRNFAPPSSGRVDITDEITPGLTLRVTASGVKSWSVRYRPKGGDQCREGVGTYPEVSLTDARARAKALTAAAAVGRDLVAEEDATKAAAVAAEAVAVARARTVKEAVGEYIENYCKPNQRRWQLTERMFCQWVLPRLGDRSLVNVRRADIVELLDDLQHKHALGAQVNRIHAALKHMLNWAVEREWLEVNPAGPIKKRVKEIAKDRVLSDDELRAIWIAANGLTDPSKSFIKLLILSGQRRDEVRCVPWSELDLDAGLWVIPAARNKAKREHVFPLTGPLIAIFAGLPKLGEHALTVSGTGPYCGQKRLKEIIDRESGVSGWTLHDIRRTVASGMAGLNVSHDVIGRVLNHSKGGVTAIYNRHDYMNEKRSALEAWGNRVFSVVMENLS